MNAPSFVVMGISFISVAAAERLGAKPSIPGKVDVICSVSGYKYREVHPELAGGTLSDLGPHKWSFRFRYSLDLVHKLYWSHEGRDKSATKLFSVSSRKVVFYNHWRDYEAIDLVSGRYVAWGMADASHSSLTRGQCRLLKFSR